MFVEDVITFPGSFLTELQKLKLPYHFSPLLFTTVITRSPISVPTNSYSIPPCGCVTAPAHAYSRYHDLKLSDVVQKTEQTGFTANRHRLGSRFGMATYLTNMCSSFVFLLLVLSSVWPYRKVSV
jgi:hypothetical protein